MKLHVGRGLWTFDVRTEQMNAIKMIWYDIYLMQLGVRPVAMVGKLVKKYERDSYIKKEKQ